MIKASISFANPVFFRNIDTDALCPFNFVEYNRNADILDVTLSGNNNVGRFVFYNPDAKRIVYNIILQLTPRSIVTDDYGSLTVDIRSNNSSNYSSNPLAGNVTLESGTYQERHRK